MGHDHSHDSHLPEGVYDVEYYEGRQKKLQLIYRLRRRTEEVYEAIQKHGQGTPSLLIDVGTADALMLDNLKKLLPDTKFVGLDRSFDLLNTTRLPKIHKVQGEALSLPYKSEIADAVVATAIIEHVPDPNKMMQECRRVLKPGGIVILTTPAPFMEKIASTLGILKEAGHHETLNMKKLAALATNNGFSVVQEKWFMFSPIGFPAERTFEKIFLAVGLKIIMANQLLVARRN